MAGRYSERNANSLKWSASALVVAAVLSAAGAVAAQDSDSKPAADEVVVTGFRASLTSAIETKRRDNDIVDVINAEDIADFPDLNLAESLQRIPGVAIDRDGGEGRSITVRGLSGDFTRVRLNGLEALATTGGKDSSGGSNRGRAFDFQVFASELFNSLTVRKSQSAEVEEGSLGATVDLRTARPFDYKGSVVAAGAQYGYNDLGRKSDPRATLLLSDRWLDGKLGALVSLAYATRNTIEEGSSTGRWENPSVAGNSAGCFETPTPCNVPVGTYSNVNSAWHPRIPRYGRLTYDWTRIGATGAVQYRPTAATTVSFDVAYALLDGTRQENYLEIISTSRSGAGNPRTDVTNPTFDSLGHLVKATFDDVDVRTEDRRDELTTEFAQYSLGIEHKFNDRFSANLLVGLSKSIQDNPVQTTVSFDRYDNDGYKYDYTNQKLPGFDYGFDVTNPANWVFGTTQTLGDASLIRMRPNKSVNTFENARLDLKYELNDTFTLKAGVLMKEYGFRTQEQRRFVIGGITEGAVPLPAGVTVASVSRLIEGFGRNMGIPSGTPTRWLAPDLDKIAAALGINCNCVNQYGDFRLSGDNQRGNNRSVDESDRSYYGQVDFRMPVGQMSVRGNFGARYATTQMSATGYVGTSLVTVDRYYDDWLPSANLVLEVTPEIYVRAAAAKVMSRPQLPFLTPGGSINNTARTLSIGNPLLEPIRAKTFDMSFEWYPDKETQFTAGFFFKNLASYVQSAATTIPFSETGLPDSLLSNGNTGATIFTVTQQLNTSGGKLKGFELSVTKPLTFLPIEGLGVILNYTKVDSNVEYITSTATNTKVIQPLVGLSPNSWNATLYYEKDKLSARVSGAFRDGYLTGVPGGNGNDVRGKNETFNVDVSASYDLTDRITLTFEGINLTDQFDDRWISSQRKSSESYEHTGRQYYAGVRYRY